MFEQDSSEDVSINVGENTFSEVAITFAEEGTDVRSVFTMNTGEWEKIPVGPNDGTGRLSDELRVNGVDEVDRVYRTRDDPSHLKIRFYANADLSTSKIQRAVNIVLGWVNERAGYKTYKIHDWNIEVNSASEDIYRYNN